jgi:hypothetical protein
MEWFHWLGLVFAWLWHPFHDSYRYRKIKLPIWSNVDTDGQTMLRKQDDEAERWSKVIKGVGLLVMGLIFLPYDTILGYAYPLGVLIWFIGHSLTFDQLWYFFTYEKFMSREKWCNTLEVVRDGPVSRLLRKVLRY